MSDAPKIALSDLDRIAEHMTAAPAWLVEPRFRNHPLWFGFAIASAFEVIGKPGWQDWAQDIIAQLTAAGAAYSEPMRLDAAPHLGVVKVARLRFV